MSYSYQTEKPRLFTPEAQEAILATAFKARQICSQLGCVTMGELMTNMPRICDSWLMIAVVDRLAEIGYLRESYLGENTPGQHRTFRWAVPA